MPKITLEDGAPLSYDDTGGDGKVLVLAHPFSGNQLSWNDCRQYFAQAGYRVIAYSRRGYYKSGPVGKSTQAADLLALLDALHITDPIDIVGVAAGTTIVYDWMLSHPHRSGRGVAACGLLGIEDPLIAEARGILQPEWFMSMPHEARELSASFRYRHSEAIEDWLRIFHMNHLDHDVPPQQPSQSITLDKLATLGERLMLLGGESDLYAPPALLEAVGNRLPSAPLAVLNQCGHAPHVEQPEEFARTVLAFLQD